MEFIRRDPTSPNFLIQKLNKDGLLIHTNEKVSPHSISHFGGLDVFLNSHELNITDPSKLDHVENLELLEDFYSKVTPIARGSSKEVHYACVHHPRWSFSPRGWQYGAHIDLYIKKQE